MVRKPPFAALVLFAAATVVTVVLTPSAQAVTTIDGPIGLGTAESFAVLAGSTVTIATNPTTTVTGDIGLSPGSSVTGDAFLALTGVQHVADSVADQAKLDLTTAYDTAASLTPIQTGLGDLTGLSLAPGVYAGGALSLTGGLTLAGSASSVWVFQAASTLTVASAAIVTVTGGASICNVFWQVGSSATLGAGSDFVGTIMADQSITAVTGAVVEGRLLARAGAVTLDTNTLTRPSGCSAPDGTVTSSPTITSDAPPSGEVGAEYTHTIASSGAPSATYAITGGTLPPGLSLDSATGVLSGTPVTAGSYDVTITAANGTAPDASVDYTVLITESAQTVAPSPEETVAPSSEETAVAVADSGALADETDAAGAELAASGADQTLIVFAAGVALIGGIVLLLVSQRRRRDASPG